MAIERARRGRAKLRAAISGHSKSGKSFSALKIARGLIAFLAEHDELPGLPSQPGYGRVCVIDTEHRSSEKYAWVRDNDPDPDRFDFDVIDFKGPYSPENYLSQLHDGEKDGYTVIIIDQGSHEWDGLGGSLQKHAKLTNESKSKNGYITWQQITPSHQSFIEGMNASPSHVICTFRAKVKHRYNQATKEVVKIGFKPIARDTTEYEFDVYGMMGIESRQHIIKFDGTRCKAISHQTIIEPGDDLGRLLGEWLLIGDVETVVDRKMIDDSTTRLITDLIKQSGLTDAEVMESLTDRGASRVNQLYPNDAEEIIKSLKKMIKQAKLQEKVVEASAGTTGFETVDKIAVALASPEPEPESVAESEPVQEAVTSDDYWCLIGGEDTEPTLFTAEGVQDIIDSNINDIMIARMGDDEYHTPDHYGFTRSDPPVTQQSDDSFVANVAPVNAPPSKAFRDAQIATETLTPTQIGDELLGQMEAQSAGSNGTPSFDLKTIQGRQAANAYAGDVAEEVGYDIGRWKAHVKSLGSNKCEFLDLTPDSMRRMIEDLHLIKEDKDNNPKTFTIDAWAIEGEPEPPKSNPKPKGRPPGSKNRSK